MAYSWTWFRTNMSKIAEQNESNCTQYLKYIELYDGFVDRFIQRPHGLSGERPQDYVACVLLVRAFRLMIGSVWLGSSGYPELCPNLIRTIWEIALRLSYFKPEPAQSALGFLLHGAAEEINMMEADISYRKASGIEGGNLAKNRNTMKTHYARLSSIAVSKGLDPIAIENKYGRINIKEVCKTMKLGYAYKVNYAFNCGHIHERNATTDTFAKDRADCREYNLGPRLSEDDNAAVYDSIYNFSIAAVVASEYIEDNTYAQEALRIQSDIVKTGKENYPGW